MCFNLKGRSCQVLERGYRHTQDSKKSTWFVDYKMLCTEYIFKTFVILTLTSKPRGPFYDNKSSAVKWRIKTNTHSGNLVMRIFWNNGWWLKKVRWYEIMHYCLLRFGFKVVILQLTNTCGGPICCRLCARLCIAGAFVRRHTYIHRNMYA